MKWKNIATGLDRGYDDMLAAVTEQEGIENEVQIRGRGGYCIFTVQAKGNVFADKSDQAIRTYFADKIKALVQEEGQPWRRDNTETAEFLSLYSLYRVNDCYYAYETLLGIDRLKNPEYGAVGESRRPARIRLSGKAEGKIVKS